MRDALTFIFRTLVDLYIITFVLRLILQWVRADTRNPLVYFILRVTNPAVMPLRRYVPPLGGLDTATLIVVFALELVAAIVLINLACIGDTNIIQLIEIAALRLIRVTLLIYMIVVLVYVILSWVSPGSYNPAAMLLSTIAEPALKPFRRLIPSIGGLDLSPLFAIIAIQAIMIMLPLGSAMAGLQCTAFGQPL